MARLSSVSVMASPAAVATEQLPTRSIKPGRQVILLGPDRRPRCVLQCERIDRYHGVVAAIQARTDEIFTVRPAGSEGSWGLNQTFEGRGRTFCLYGADHQLLMTFRYARDGRGEWFVELIPPGSAGN